MKIPRLAAIAAGLAALALSTASCSAVTKANSPATSFTYKASPTTADTSWLPTGYTQWNYGLGFDLNPTGYKCKSYQDGCSGVNVISQYGCPGGIYIEVSYTDDSGAAIDKANDITPGVRAMGIAKASLSPPGGITSDMDKVRITKMNCLN